MKKRPYILTIAGIDPSSGAGLTADIKTLEALKCYGLSICSAHTIQDDLTCRACYWTPIDVIRSQIDLLFARFRIEFVKIGIVENWHILHRIIDLLLEKNEHIQIILDPILQSSTQFRFHTSNEKILDILLHKIYLITPNYDEICQLYSSKDVEETMRHMASKTNMLLKGGHRKECMGTDQLFTKNEKKFTLHPKRNNCTEKHGSGCVLSSAITAYLAMNFSLLKACYRGKRYTEKVLSSNKSLLGYHG